MFHVKQAIKKQWYILAEFVDQNFGYVVSMIIAIFFNVIALLVTGNIDL